MKKLPFFIHILLFLCALNLKAQDFEYSTTCQNAYRSIFQLKINHNTIFCQVFRQLQKLNLKVFNEICINVRNPSLDLDRDVLEKKMKAGVLLQ